MTDSTASLRRTIGSAGDLQSVVRTMKALAAASIGQYEQSVRALNDYRGSVERGLAACFRAAGAAPRTADETVGTAGSGKAVSGTATAIVFGSDQGLVGQFNEAIADQAMRTLQALPEPARYWAVGERVQARLLDAGVPVLGLFEVPGSVEGIAPLVGQIQIESEAHRTRGGYAEVHVFHNAPATGVGFAPSHQRLLPLDAAWRRALAAQPWPTPTRPEAVFDLAETLPAFVREHLFITLFRACAESLASENACRLAAMERADKNIDELLHDLHRRFERVRQNSIDNELFDVTAGFSALA